MASKATSSGTGQIVQWKRTFDGEIETRFLEKEKPIRYR